MIKSSFLLLLVLLHLACGAYVRFDLVANRAGLPTQTTATQQASVFDSNLVNPWGLTFGAATPAWIANNGASTLAIIAGTGAVNSLSVRVGTDSPTGIVANPSATDFLIPSSTGGNATASAFITATEQGDIWAWGASISDLTKAVRVASSNSSVFKGLAQAANGTQHFLYATDFAQKRVVVFDTKFNRVQFASNSFVDPNIPSNFSPFGIANILGDIFVAYAEQNATSPGDEIDGSGLGFISVFTANGTFVRRFASQGTLNAPWGMVLSPPSFGQFGGSLLVGNFGNGAIWAYDLANGQQLGQLSTSSGNIIINGLWGLAFGNGVLGQPTNTLFFSAGINDEADGLFGRIVNQ
jgi:uncharacterized protein (TIGR03118 family)